MAALDRFTTALELAGGFARARSRGTRCSTPARRRRARDPEAERVTWRKHERRRRKPRPPTEHGDARTPRFAGADADQGLYYGRGGTYLRLAWRPEAPE